MKAEDRALEHCCAKCVHDKFGCSMKVLHNGRDCIKCGNYIKGYEQAEKDLTDKAKVSSGWDGFYYGQGYHQAEKDLELTVDDIMKIDALLIEMWNQSGNKYQEVLKRFKNLKK